LKKSQVDKQGTIGYSIGNMKFVTVKDLRTSPVGILKKLPTEREMIITNNGKSVALLIPVNDEMMEETVSTVRRAKAVNGMKKMQKISATLGNDKMSLDDINAVVKDIRKNKK